MQKDEYSEQTTNFFKKKTSQFSKSNCLKKILKSFHFFGTIQSNWKVEIKKEKNVLKKNCRPFIFNWQEHLNQNSQRGGFEQLLSSGFFFVKLKS